MALRDPAYVRLSGLDNSFLVTEDASPSPMHIGLVQLHEAAPLRGRDGAIDIERIAEYVASRLDRIPRYRQRLAYTPLERHPVWVDDASFNIHYHVRHSRLPRPGNPRQLKRMAGRILSEKLDRGKPLWELWVIEGLEDDRLAVLSKVHHCMIDGVAGSELLSVLLSAEPMEKPEPPPHWDPRPVPAPLRLGADEAARALATPRQLAEGLGRLVRDEGSARHDLAERVRAVGRLFEELPRPPTPVPFNRPIGPHRRFDWMTMPIERIRRVRRVLGGTLNDVVLATAAGAFGRYLARERGLDLAGLRFQAMVPVSVRTRGESGAGGNRISAWIVDLPIAESDPVARLESVREQTLALKKSKRALAAETLAQVTEWTGPSVLALGARLMLYGTPFNTVVTNVPGPRSPLYLLESRLLELHAQVPLAGTIGVGIALFSSAGTLSWGFNADWDLVPDLHQLVLATERSFEALCDAAGDERGV